MSSTKEVKVNIGCGPHGLSGWTNLDWGVLPFLSKLPWLCRTLVFLHLLPEMYCRPWPSNPRLWDCRKRLPFRNGSVDFIYTSHFIEHLPRYQTLQLLTECKRALRPSGVLRISVPDVRLLAERFLKDDSRFFLGLEGETPAYPQLTCPADLFVQHFYGYDVWSKPNWVQKMQRLFTRGHVWMYDFASLRALLLNAGFQSVVLCKPAEGKVPGIDFLDIHRTGSLFVEAFPAKGS